MFWEKASIRVARGATLYSLIDANVLDLSRAASKRPDMTLGAATERTAQGQRSADRS
jgi:hypothetical protein